MPSITPPAALIPGAPITQNKSLISACNPFLRCCDARSCSRRAGILPPPLQHFAPPPACRARAGLRRQPCTMLSSLSALTPLLLWPTEHYKPPGPPAHPRAAPTRAIWGLLPALCQASSSSSPPPHAAMCRAAQKLRAHCVHAAHGNGRRPKRAGLAHTRQAGGCSVWIGRQGAAGGRLCAWGYQLRSGGRRRGLCLVAHVTYAALHTPSHEREHMQSVLAVNTQHRSPSGGPTSGYSISRIEMYALSPSVDTPSLNQLPAGIAAAARG